VCLELSFEVGLVWAGWGDGRVCVVVVYGLAHLRCVRWACEFEFVCVGKLFVRIFYGIWK
jgi:hypothetical protein